MGVERPALSAEEARVFAVVTRSFRDRSGPPTLKEIADACGRSSTRSAGYHLDNIAAKGYIERTGRGRYRLVEDPAPKAVRLADTPRRFVVAIAGHIAAGPPIEPATPDGEQLDLGQLFAAIDVQILQVRGSSMIEEAILPGDYIAVRPVAKVDAGRIVVAEIGGAHTLKVYRVLKGLSYLYPRNREMQPIELVSRDDPRLLGVYVGLIRVPARVKGGAK